MLSFSLSLPSLSFLQSHASDPQLLAQMWSQQLSTTIGDYSALCGKEDWKLRDRNVFQGSSCSPWDRVVFLQSCCCCCAYLRAAEHSRLGGTCWDLTWERLCKGLQVHGQREHSLFLTDTKSREKSCRWVSIWIQDLSVFLQARKCGGETSAKAGPLLWRVRLWAGHFYLSFSIPREDLTVPCTDQELSVFFTTQQLSASQQLDIFEKCQSGPNPLF